MAIVISWDASRTLCAIPGLEECLFARQSQVVKQAARMRVYEKWAQSSTDGKHFVTVIQGYSEDDYALHAAVDLGIFLLGKSSLQEACDSSIRPQLLLMALHSGQCFYRHYYSPSNASILALLA